MMGFWSRVESAMKNNASNSKKPENFYKYEKQIKETQKYIEAKREAFYAKNNDIKRRW